MLLCQTIVNGVIDIPFSFWCSSSGHALSELVMHLEVVGFLGGTYFF